MRESAPYVDVIGGRYRVNSRIASGGMGQVLRALDTVLGRTVAIKVLSSDLASRPGFVERFRAEAQTVAQVSHPNIVQIHDWGETGSTYYMVMEYVRGKNLREILATRGRLELGHACRLMIEILEALDAAHARGLVHRDVKPENVMVTVDGRVKVADFGLARLVERPTLTGGLLGTVAYVAPEQARGETVDRRTDLYSAGCLMYELFTGSIPFEGDAAQILYRHLNERVPRPSELRPEIPESIDRIVQKATEPSVEARYSSAAEMRDELRSAAADLPASPPLAELSGELTSEIPSEILETMVPVEKRKRKKWPWILAALILLTAAAAGWTFRPTRVPRDLVGETLATAIERLASADLDAKITLELSDEEPRDEVLDVDPDPGSLVRRGREVRLTVSAGPAVADLVDLRGMPLEEAESWLEEAGFQIGATEERYDPAEKGTVIDQDPKKGTHRKDTPVNLVVSAGPEMVDVPAVTQKTFEEAKAALEQAGLRALREEVFNEALAGTVIDQTPKPGEKAMKGSEVRVVTSKGSEPFAMPGVKDRPCSDAKTELESRGLVVAINSQKGSPCGSNKVIDQDPLPDTMVRKGDQVTLYIA